MQGRARLTPDRAKINVKDGREMRYWQRHLKVTGDELLRAVDKVGPCAAAVKKQLSLSEVLPVPVTDAVAGAEEGTAGDAPIGHDGHERSEVAGASEHGAPE